MVRDFSELLKHLLDPATSSVALMALVTLVALGVAGMSIYAVVMALKATGRKR